MKKKTPIEKFLALSDVRKDAEVARFEREIAMSKTRPLNAAQRKQWRGIRRKMGRPAIGEGAKTIAITVERGLLRRADRYAKQHDLKRAELIAQGLKLVLSRKTG